MREQGASGEKGGLLKIEENSMFACWWEQTNRVGEMYGAEQEGIDEGTVLGNSKGGWIWSIVGTLAFTPRQQVCIEFED